MRYTERGNISLNNTHHLWTGKRHVTHKLNCNKHNCRRSYSVRAIAIFSSSDVIIEWSMFGCTTHYPTEAMCLSKFLFWYWRLSSGIMTRQVVGLSTSLSHRWRRLPGLMTCRHSVPQFVPVSLLESVARSHDLRTKCASVCPSLTVDVYRLVSWPSETVCLRPSLSHWMRISPGLMP